MSLTTASFCLAYLNMPVDVVNAISRYAGSEKWYPQRDTNGKIYRKVNPHYFVDLSEICSGQYGPLRSTLTKHSVIVNNSVRYDNAETFVQQRRMLDNGDIEITLYISIEVFTDVYKYLSIVYIISAYTTPLRQFVKGTLYSPDEYVKWNREQTIRSFRTENDVMFVNTLYQMSFVWNNEENFGEYIITPNLDEDIDNGNDDEIDWAL